MPDILETGNLYLSARLLDMTDLSVRHYLVGTGDSATGFCNTIPTLREVQHPNIDTTTAFSLSYSTARTASGLDNQHVRVPDPRASAVVRWMRTLRTWLRHTGQYTFDLRRRHWADLAAIRSEPSA